jgi:hypothetical protein
MKQFLLYHKIFQRLATFKNENDSLAGVSGLWVHWDLELDLITARLQLQLLPLHISFFNYRITSEFWPRVRARALRAPVFLSSLPPKRGAALRAPPYPSIAAMKYEVPNHPPRPSQLRWSFRQYFGVKDTKLCTGATIRPTFSGFSFLYILDLFFLLFSSFSSLLFNFFLFFSSYPSHLISSYSSRRCYSASSFSFPFIF